MLCNILLLALLAGTVSAFTFRADGNLYSGRYAVAVTGATTDTGSGANSMCESLSGVAGYVCSDCVTPAYCDADGVLEVLQGCSNGQVCKSETAYAYCTDHTSVPECECTDQLQQCDGYNSEKLLLCGQDGPFHAKECETEGHVCRSGECYDSTDPAAPTTEASSSGAVNCADKTDSKWYLETPTCQKAVYCDNGEELASMECLENEYFDPENGCQPAPPVPCADGDEGYIADKLDCGKYYVCEGGEILTTFECKGDTLYFDPNSVPPKCDTDSSICPVTTGCTALEATTTSPNPTTNEPTTEKPEEPTTEKPEEPTTEKPEEPTTEKPEEPTTEKPEEPTTEKPEEPTTEKPDEPTTEKPEEPTTEKSDEPTTEKQTEPLSTLTPITTPSPDMCNSNSEDQRFQHATDCTKYYLCAQTGHYTYEFVEEDCFSDLVFNPSTGKCDYQKNVPDCVP